MNLLSSREKSKVRKLAKNTRFWRRIHYYLGLTLALFLFLSAGTGLLLGWKKNSDTLQPPTQNGASVNMSQWLTLDQIQDIVLAETKMMDVAVDRMDVRPSKGIAKVLLKPGYWELQVDLTTGEVLSKERRYSDLIEQIHDGSIISEGFKFISMNLMSIAIIFSIFSGLWLWYGPSKIRKSKHKYS